MYALPGAGMCSVITPWCPLLAATLAAATTITVPTTAFWRSVMDAQPASAKLAITNSRFIATGYRCSMQQSNSRNMSRCTVNHVLLMITVICGE